jgi:hypothetical protein
MSQVTEFDMEGQLFHKVQQLEAELTRLREDRERLLEALRDIVEFCDDPDGSEKGESLACGLARLLPAARAVIDQARGQ